MPTNEIIDLRPIFQMKNYYLYIVKITEKS